MAKAHDLLYAFFIAGSVFFVGDWKKGMKEMPACERRSRSAVAVRAKARSSWFSFKSQEVLGSIPPATATEIKWTGGKRVLQRTF